MPTQSEYKACNALILQNYPLLHDVYAVCDGLKLRSEQSPDYIIQNIFYNGWTHNHYVSNELFFIPSRKICAFVVNVPGSIQDSAVAEMGEVYSKLDYFYSEFGGNVAVDLAFARKQHPSLAKSYQKAERRSQTELEKCFIDKLCPFSNQQSVG